MLQKLYTNSGLILLTFLCMAYKPSLFSWGAPSLRRASIA